VEREDKIIVAWLYTGLFLVLLMVVIGGITRLTHSGLSMVDWKLIGGTIPPLTDEAWQTTFEKYKQFPEYQKTNMGMELSEFKAIFFWEYLHRMLGRFLGIVFIVPYAVFLMKGWVKGMLSKKLFMLLLLGALQGGLGWFMVKSGLVDAPSVSHFRLAIHLSAAFTLLVYIYWLILDLTKVARIKDSRVSRLAVTLLVLVTIQIVYGAFTAGLKAGLIHPTFPLMGGKVFPDSPPAFSSTDFMYNPFNIQFVHRTIAWVIFFFTIFLFKKVKDSQVNTNAALLILLAVILQFLLGVGTLIYHVPVTLAVIHQLGAVLVLLTVVRLIFKSLGGVEPSV
jgi:cytochrome c oxidase assembly protein subunit 15